MSKRLLRILAAGLAAVLIIPTVWATEDEGETPAMIRVGLASTSVHNSVGVQTAAHLQNNEGFGAGYRFGYFDEDLSFVELARTDDTVTEVAVLKTQNLCYGYDETQGKTTYSADIDSDVRVGCYHIQLDGEYADYDEAAAAAEENGGFVAWIDGAYQVRTGAWFTKEEAQTALDVMESGTIVGTSSYGMSIVVTGTDRILFQFDWGESVPLGIMPDVTEADDVRTWFSGYKYRGGFQYQRIGGSGMTVVNVLPLEDYVKGVVCYEMGREWPLEALKAQATCARTYAVKRTGYHKSLGFDVCNSDYCQVYRGVGSGRADYGPSETSDRAVDETAGQVLWYGNELADTFYSSSHGGASESAKYIWGTNMQKYPYLCGVVDPYEAEAADINPRASWTVTYTSRELLNRLRQSGFGTNTSLDCLELTYSELGNVVEITVHWTNGQKNSITPKLGLKSIFGVDSIRFTVNGELVNPGGASVAGSVAVNDTDELESVEGLYVISGSGEVSELSENVYVITGKGKKQELELTVETESGSNQGGGTVVVSGSKYVFDGSGWGHQVGLSQYGAYAMAQLGFGYDEIVEFYFPGTVVDSYENE